MLKKQILSFSEENMLEKMINDTQYIIALGKNIIEEKVKYLEVILDQLLTFQDEVKMILRKTSVKRTSVTHDKPHILEIRSPFVECALTASNYRFRNYKLCKNFIQVFYTNFEEP